jgi:hypothetical protein
MFVGRDAAEQVERFFADLPAQLDGPGFFLPPGTQDAKANYTTVVSSDILTQEQAGIAQHNSQIVLIVGRFQYKDLLGVSYHSDWCGEMLTTGAVGVCRAHNDVQEDK